ncbi:MAG: DMT family transporter, partial [Acaryochloridaceae cyanobacterium CSU_5_19]|nr:DMT family transporter [Acaryochloridaceae cyanobacterium CSU_5_19]
CIGLPDQWLTTLEPSQWLTQDWHQILSRSTLSQLGQSGECLMLLAALCMAVGTVMIRQVCRHTDPLTATGWHMFLGGLPLFCGSGLWESEQWVHLNGWAWLSIAYAAIFGSAIAYGLFFYFAAQGNLTSLSSLTFLTPVFALIFGKIFLSEVLSPLQTGGVCITLASIYCINQREQLPSLSELGLKLRNALALRDDFPSQGGSKSGLAEVSVEVIEQPEGKGY